MRKAGILLGLSMFLAMAASAQDGSKADVFLGYTYTHETYSCCVSGFNLNGFDGQVAYYVKPWVGVVGDVGVNWVRTIDGSSATGQMRTYMGGVRVGLEHGPIHPYGQFLIGDAQLSSDLQTELQSFSVGGQPSTNGWAFSLGGGVDLRVAHHLYVRLGELDYLGTHFNDPFGTRFRQNNFQYKAGIVIRF